jgi:hypothetical protein
MPDLPYRAGGEVFQPPYRVIPDNVNGGWLVYVTTDPQEPQVHFNTQEEAVGYAEKMSLSSGVGFSVEEYEGRSVGR